jgi:hypothetical protein
VYFLVQSYFRQGDKLEIYLRLSNSSEFVPNLGYGIPQGLVFSNIDVAEYFLGSEIGSKLDFLICNADSYLLFISFKQLCNLFILVSYTNYIYVIYGVSQIYTILLYNNCDKIMYYNSDPRYRPILEVT